MLILKAPIEIKAKTEYLTSNDAFAQRILGSYSLMEAPMDGEDLLHLLTTPPEIYVVEGEGMASLIQNRVSNELNLKKVEILNNVLNRILVSANGNLTYQDRTFITDALYKLGIRDDRRFMQAFYRMAEETKQTNTLIDLYLSNGEYLRELIENAERLTEGVREESTETIERERENVLYERVMRRLKTGAIYQIVSNFNRTQDITGIEQNEYTVSNQTYLARQILLSYFRERTGIGDGKLVYREGNIYEETLENAGDTVTNVRNELTAAVMMEMLKNIYHTGFERFDVKNPTYFHFEDTFFRSSEETFSRLTREGDVSVYSAGDTNTYLTENAMLAQSEIELLSESAGAEITEEELIRITESVNALNRENELRRRRYEQVVERVRESRRPAEQRSGFERTKEDAILALTSPEKLREKLTESEEAQEEAKAKVIEELRGILPESTLQVYELLERQRDGEYLRSEETFFRPAEVGELLQDIHAAERSAEEAQKLPQLRRDRTEIIRELRNILPESSLALVERIERQGEGDLVYSEETFIRPDEIINLLQEIRSAESAEDLAPGKRELLETVREDIRRTQEDTLRTIASMRERTVEGESVVLTHPGEENAPEEERIRVQNIVEETIRRAGGPSLEEGAASGGRGRRRAPAGRSTEGEIHEVETVPTIHRSTEAISSEELEEQLIEMSRTLSQKLKQDVVSEIVTEQKSTTVREVRTSDTQEDRLMEADIRRMIESGVRSQMNAISNEVLGKLEKQMNNEKRRRGY